MQFDAGNYCSNYLKSRLVNRCRANKAVEQVCVRVWLQALSGGQLHHGHFEMLRVGVNKKIEENKMFAVWRIPAPWKPVCRKGIGHKLGGGKGSVHHYVTPVKAGRIIIELGGECEWNEVYWILVSGHGGLSLSAVHRNLFRVFQCSYAFSFGSFSALTLLVGRQEGHLVCKKHEWCGNGMVICLERDADLHMAQLMPLPLTVSCSSKIQIGFTFLVPANPGSPGKRAVKRVCVCVMPQSYVTV